MTMEKPTANRRAPASRQGILRGTKTVDAGQNGQQNFVLVIHGGAGTMNRDSSTPEQRAQYRTNGGEAMDAAVAAVMVMEDCPLFNSGKGAVFNVAGKVRFLHLAGNIFRVFSLLCGYRMSWKHPSCFPNPQLHIPAIPASRRGASLTLLTCTRNPSQLARALYLAPELAPHPMLSGAAAEAIGSDLGIGTVDPSYHWTEARWREHRRGLGLPEEPVQYPDVPDSDSETATEVGTLTDQKSEKFELLDLMPTGTVGAVALDVRGCISAVTSTGGRTNKLVGRVGDTPVMGSGFWAGEWKREGGLLKRTWDHVRGKPTYEGVGVSGTGDGDYFIRLNAASTIARRMQYLDEPLHKAAQQVVDDLYEDGGLGGIIALDLNGNVALPLNCSGMYRGVIRPDGVPMTAIFNDEELSEL
ncbi:nucleophile aminohydrolase [Melanogaster broomeanus]|nr:nucleophile aminohydrolase [Melanogaster broomeanus]